MKKILWLEDYNLFVSESMRKMPKGIEITPVRNVTDGEFKIKKEHYDLLILDPGIPLQNEEEEKKYPPDKTDNGYETGFEFYLRNKEYLEGTKILVLSISRMGKFKRFKETGIPPKHFATKYTLRDPVLFWEKINKILDAEN